MKDRRMRSAVTLMGRHAGAFGGEVLRAGAYIAMAMFSAACAGNPSSTGSLSANLSSKPALGSQGPMGGRFAPLWLMDYSAPKATDLVAAGLKFSAELFDGEVCWKAMEVPCYSILDQNAYTQCFTDALAEADAYCALADKAHFMELKNLGSAAQVTVHRVATDGIPGATLFGCSGSLASGYSCTLNDGSNANGVQVSYLTKFIKDALENFVYDTSPCDDSSSGSYFTTTPPPGAKNEMCYVAGGIYKFF